MRGASRLACLVFALLLPAASGAIGEWPVEAMATRLDIERGALQADLSLLVLEQVMQTQPMASGSFELSGQSLHLEVDSSDPVIGVPGTPATKPPISTTYQDFQEFAVHGTQKRPAYEVIVLPSNGTRIEVSDSCGRFASSQDETVTRNPWVAAPVERSPLEANTQQAVKWKNCAEAHLIVTGDFLLSLWQQDFILESDGKTSSYQTGRLQPQALAGAPDSTAAAARFQQAFLHVTDGNLSFQLAAGVPHEVYLQRGAQVHSEAGAVLVDATGTLRTEAGLQSFQAQRIEAQGNIEARLLDAGVGKPLQAALGGELNSIDMDGTIVSLAVTTPAQGPWPWLAAIGAVAVPSLALPLLRRRSLRPARIEAARDHAQEELALLRYGAALAWTSKFVDWMPNDARANYLHAKALAGLSRFHEALRHFQVAALNLRASDLDWTGALACEAARTIMTLRLAVSKEERKCLFDEGLNVVRNALAINPAFVREAERLPLLHPYLDALRANAGSV